MNHDQNPQWNTHLDEWPTNINNKAKKHWIRKGSSTCQHKESNFKESPVHRTDREPGL